MKVEERKSIRRTNKELEQQHKEEQKMKALQDKLKIEKGRSESPFVRVHDLDSNASKQNSDKNKDKLDVSNNKSGDNSKLTTTRKGEEQKDKSKTPAANGKSGGANKSIAKNVKNTNQQKPERKFARLQEKDGNKLTTDETESIDEEELNSIPLEEALAKIEEIYKEVKELEDNRKGILNNKAITEISKKLRCKPINEKLKELKKQMKKYERVRAKHLGILDKLPKDSPLYAFAYNCQYAQRMKKIALKKIEEEQKCVQNFLNQSDD